MFKSLKKVAGDEHSPKAEMVLNAPQNMDTSFENIHIETSPNKKHVSSTTLRYVTQNEKMPIEGAQNPQIGDVNHSETNTQDTLDKSDPRSRYIESLMPFYKELRAITESIIQDETHHDKYTNDLKAEWCLDVSRANSSSDYAYYVIGDEKKGDFLAKCRDNTMDRNARIMHQLLFSSMISAIIQQENNKNTNHNAHYNYKTFLKILDKQEKTGEEKKKEGQEDTQNTSKVMSPATIVIDILTTDSSTKTLKRQKLTRELYDECTDLVDPRVLWSLKRQYIQTILPYKSEQECVESNERPSSAGQWNATRIAKQVLCPGPARIAQDGVSLI